MGTNLWEEIIVIYCRLQNACGEYAIYSFGIDTENMTGNIRFHRDGSFEIINNPGCCVVNTHWIYMLVDKERENFRKGVFAEDIYYSE